MTRDKSASGDLPAATSSTRLQVETISASPTLGVAHSSRKSTGTASVGSAIASRTPMGAV
jgi:hypothetical protein